MRYCMYCVISLYHKIPVLHKIQWVGMDLSRIWTKLNVKESIFAELFWVSKVNCFSNTLFLFFFVKTVALGATPTLTTYKMMRLMLA
jgi:hypothetical protein